MSEILGVLFAVTVGFLFFPKLAAIQDASNEKNRQVATAEQQSQVIEAATTYIKNNNVAIQATATATTPTVITVPMLQAAAVNLLPSSFNSKNPYGQTWQVEVLQPTAGNLQALTLSTGGTALTDVQANNIAKMVKPTGGFIPKNDSTIYATGTAYGAYANWQIPTTGYTGITAGSLASLSTFSNGSLSSNYLYRNAVPGQPQLNQMNTPLIMASSQTLNSACTTIGAIAQDGNGTVLSCQNYTWQQQGSAYWKDPVVNKAALNALPCNATTQWQTRIVQTPTTGSGPRAYTCNGATWLALAVDDTGNMTVPGTVTFGQAQVNTVVTAGTACSPNGLVARDSVGLILSCQSGSWQGGQGIGYGQSWTSPGRALNSTYTNITTKPILVNITGTCGSIGGAATYIRLYVDSVLAGGWYASLSNNAIGGSASAIVPVNSSYYAIVNGNCSLMSWAELR